jgi:hypothetical protein
MEIVEKVAQAIQATGHVAQQHAIEVARAALEAMACFPTTMMIEAGKDALTELAEPTDDEMRFVWLEMINAALDNPEAAQEKPGG